MSDTPRTTSELAQDVVMKWTSDKNVSVRIHGGVPPENHIILVDCIKEALDTERTARLEAEREKEELSKEVDRLKKFENQIGSGWALVNAEELQAKNSELSAQLERAMYTIRAARSAMQQHDNAPYQCESTEGAEGSILCVRILDEALKEKESR